MELSSCDPAIEQSRRHRKHRRRHLMDARRLFHVPRLDAVFGPQKADQMAIAFEMPVHEIE